LAAGGGAWSLPIFWVGEGGGVGGFVGGSGGGFDEVEEFRVNAVVAVIVCVGIGVGGIGGVVWAFARGGGDGFFRWR
jgi:hypothetical protein